jgi:plasmid stabilization system protein ParE
MSSNVSIAAGKANLGGAETCTAFTGSCTTSQIISETLARICPDKTWAYIAKLTGKKERAAKHRKSGSRPYSAADLHAILNSDSGFIVLAALMAGSRMKWWRVCHPLMQVAEVQAMQLRARKKISQALQGAVDADSDLTAAIARADALLVHDADFARPHADAVRAMAGLSRGAVAAPARKGRVK